MSLKTNHYYKTIGIENDSNWMKDIYIKILRKIRMNGWQIDYEVEIFGFSNSYRKCKPSKSTWLMWDKFDKQYFREITKEEYERQKLVALI